MSKITYVDKENVETPTLPPKNDVLAGDMNEIKASTNAIYDGEAVQKGVLLDPANKPTLTPEGAIFWCGECHTIEYISGLGPTIRAGATTILLYYNDTGVTIAPFKVIHLKSVVDVGGVLYPTPELADASDWAKTQGTLAVSTHSADDGELLMTAIYSDRMVGGDTSGLTLGAQLWLSADGSGSLVDVRPPFPDYAISMGGAANSEVAPNGQIFVNQTTNIYETFNDAWDGGFRETINFYIDTDGVTGVLENVDNTRDLTMLFSDGFSTLDCTPACTISLTPGTDTEPQQNYIYILKSAKALAVSTSSFPTEEHIKVADVQLFSAARTIIDGPLGNRNWNDHIKKEDDNGHLLHITERLRQNHAEWDSGAEGTCIVTGGTAVDVAVTGGKVYQIHKQDFQAFDTATGSHVYVLNDFVTPYRKTSDIESINTDALGNPLSNTSYSLVLIGVQNKSGEPCQLLMAAPVGTYSKNTPDNAVSDALNYSVYDFPKMVKGKAFLIARFTYVNNGGIISLYDTEDLRGKVPNATAGGGAGGSGVTEWTALSDTPATYVDQAGNIPRVAGGEAGLEFYDIQADLDLKADKTNVLEKDNTTPFTPTADYHPSTKLYVDNLQTAIDAKQSTSEKGQANGYAELDGGGQVPLSQIPASVQGGIKVIGEWNASTNNPDLSSLTLEQGQAYQVIVGGNTDLNGETGWRARDIAVWSDTLTGNYYKLDNTDDVFSVNGKTGVVTVTKADVGLSNVDNTSDANKPVSTAQQTALDDKLSKTDTGAQSISSDLDFADGKKRTTNAPFTSEQFIDVFKRQGVDEVKTSLTDRVLSYISLSGLSQFAWKGVAALVWLRVTIDEVYSEINFNINNLFKVDATTGDVDASGNVAIANDKKISLQASSGGSTELIEIGNTNGLNKFRASGNGLEVVLANASGSFNIVDSALAKYLFSILDSGDVSIAGDLDFATGKGVQFAGGDVFGAYEEKGSWTPAIPGLVLNVIDASYAKTGKEISGNVRLRYTSGTGSGNVLTGLPESADTNATFGVTFSAISNFPIPDKMITGEINGSEIRFYNTLDNGARTPVDFTGFVAGTALDFSFKYRAV